MAQKSAAVLVTLMAVTLSGCAAEYPYKRVQFCMNEMADAEQVKATLQSVSRSQKLEFTDSSESVQRDLRTLESPLADQQVIRMDIDDPRWLSRNGPILISNIGEPTPLRVRVSFFRPQSVVYSDQRTERTAGLLIAALEKDWNVSERAEGAKHLPC